jgi:hypothetical protein
MNHAFVRRSTKRTGYCITLWQQLEAQSLGEGGKGNKIGTRYHKRIVSIKTKNLSPVTVGKVIMWWCNDGLIPTANKKEGIEEVIHYS